jgi:hypothetical protein
MRIPDNCTCRPTSVICPAWKRIRRWTVTQMYLEGMRMTDICEWWNLNHAASVINLVGKGTVRGMPGLRRGIQAINPTGAVEWSFFPIKSCRECGFGLSSVMKALKTGKPYRGLTWRYCT